MNLVIDIGNTLLKYAIFDKDRIIERGAEEDLGFFSDEKIFQGKNKFHKAIVSSVRSIMPELMTAVSKYCKVHVLDSNTRLPFKNLYKTPETLGNDRLAGIAGAFSLYPKKNVLVIDAGTCITIDLLRDKGIYQGGSISPGIRMRLKAVHTFTGKLPLVNLREFDNDFGYDTETSILAGVVNGTIDEIQTAINRQAEKYSDLLVLICGGDASFLVKRLKNSIFAVPDLVLTGLNELLEYNEK